MTNGFIETEEQQALRAAVAAMAGNYRQDYYLRRPAQANTPTLWSEAGKLGFLGVNLPEQYGGGGAGMYQLSLVMEEFSATRRPADHGGLPGDHGTIIAKFGTDAQKRDWLPGIADGSGTMAFAITEPDAGSNSHRITTTARRDGERLDPDGPEGLHLRRGPGAGGPGRQSRRPVRTGAQDRNTEAGPVHGADRRGGLHVDQDPDRARQPRASSTCSSMRCGCPPTHWWVLRTRRSRNCSPG